MKKQLLYILFVGCLLTSHVGVAQLVTTFNFTGALQTFTVPCGVDSVFIQAWGAQGGSGTNGGQGSIGGAGGLGGYAEGSLAVTPGQILFVTVGGQGAAPTGGFNGGASGGSQNAGGGGGASDVRVNSSNVADRVIVAGGGGGGGRAGCESTTNIVGGTGGAGGGGNGGNGTDAPTSGGVAGGGQGGVGTAGGAAGAGCSGFLGAPGIAAVGETGGAGGNGQSCCCFSFGSIPAGGGGGGGFAGGGGGGGGSAGTVNCSGNDKGAGGGGAGGTSYVGGLTVAGTMTSGIWLGNGQVNISWADPTPATPSFTASPTAACVGDVVIFTVGAVENATTYDWTVTGDLTIVTASGTTSIGVLVGATGGTVAVTAQNVACNLSSSPAFASISANQLPSVTANSSASTVCAGTSVTLTGGGASTYVWDNSAVDGVAFAISSTTTYSVTGTDANGCSSSDDTTITVNQLPVVGTVASPSASVCSGKDITLSGSGASTYTWSNGISNGVSFVAAAGTYNVTGTDANNCSASASITVGLFPLPSLTVAATPNDTVCTGENVTLTANGAATYAWSDGIVNGTAFVANSNNSYDVTGTDANGCSATASVDVTAENCVGINEVDGYYEVVIAPNPFTASFSVTLAEKFNAKKIRVTDVSGRIVKEVKIGGEKNISVNTETWANGVYILEITGHGKNIQRTIVK
jgi:hypothetical protein